MNRKRFLGSVLPLLAGTGFTAHSTDVYTNANDEGIHRVPPYLKNGSLIGITSPAGFITQDEIEPAVKMLKDWGFEVRIGNCIGKRDFSFGGTDAERVQDMQQMLNDPQLSAILCARGGYGVVRIIDQLDFTKFLAAPKWVIGFSDITVLHCHLSRNFHCASIHSKMCNSFPSDWAMAEPEQKLSIEGIRNCLLGEKMLYECPHNIHNRWGSATGRLVGGNLKIIESLAGTASNLNTDGKILYLEDTGEYLYSIDRMFWNLKRTGKLTGLKGLIIGGFRIKKDDEGEEFGRSLEQIVMEKVAPYNYPVCFGFPVGHQKYNLPLRNGTLHHLQVSANGVMLRSA